MIKKGITIFVFSIFIFVLGFSTSAIIKGKLNTSNTKIEPTDEQLTQSEVKGETLHQPLEGQATSPEFKVTRVIDGDTVEIEEGQKIRYIGIDTPETVHPDKDVQCFGKEASSKNTEFVMGKSILLEKDVSEADKYGRLLRYVYVGDVFVNDFLVREGYAKSSSFPPDVKHQDKFREAEQEARQNNRGLWAYCQTGANQPVMSSETSSTDGCQIKGNISSSNEKIYHVPGQRYWDKTQIDESKGERWFCTEEEALNAGFRKSKV